MSDQPTQEEIERVRAWQEQQQRNNRYRCAIVFHEVGHLYGLQHSERGVMAAVVKTIPPVCKRIVPLSWGEQSSWPIMAHTAKEQKR